METSLAILFYQNLLVAEGLENILHENDITIIKSELQVKSKNLTDLKTISDKVNLIMVEANLPFPIFDKLGLIHKQFGGKETKIVLIVNIVNQRLINIIRKGLVDGVILKSCDFEELLFAIKQVEEDHKYYSSIIANIIMDNGRNSRRIKISKRERQILSLIAEMKSTVQIAEKLLISTSTVKTHRRNLMLKLHAKNMLCLLRVACRENLLNEEIDYCGCCYRQFTNIDN